MEDKKTAVSQKKIDDTLKKLEGLSYIEWLKVKFIKESR